MTSAASVDDDGDGGTPADCAERCATRATECQAPADVAAQSCAMICGGGLTTEQLECLESSDCNALGEAVLAGAPLCGIGGADSSGGGDGNPNASIGDSCSCTGGDVSYESCSGTDGPCGDLTCYVLFGEGTCSQTCTASIDSDDCPVGECTVHLVEGVEVGSWCEIE